MIILPPVKIYSSCWSQYKTDLRVSPNWNAEPFYYLLFCCCSHGVGLVETPPPVI